ncbi:hypothetical protein U0070_015634 [Myodes glareolus]|uniref:Uncharacterized protein n=1 Tax=Myodes glareolus TaxID=447135 RepID=A0AAW0HQG4_MYOGA
MEVTEKAAKEQELLVKTVGRTCSWEVLEWEARSQEEQEPEVRAHSGPAGSSPRLRIVSPFASPLCEPSVSSRNFRKTLANLQHSSSLPPPVFTSSCHSEWLRGPGISHYGTFLFLKEKRGNKAVMHMPASAV